MRRVNVRTGTLEQSGTSSTEKKIALPVDDTFDLLAEQIIQRGITQPPNLKSLFASSRCPPGACTTPLMQTCAATMILCMERFLDAARLEVHG